MYRAYQVARGMKITKQVVEKWLRTAAKYGWSSHIGGVKYWGTRRYYTNRDLGYKEAQQIRDLGYNATIDKYGELKVGRK